MISGNTELFNKPLRTIEGRVEVIDTSTQTKTGTAIRLEGCRVGVPLDIYVETDNPEGMVVSRYGKNLFDYTKHAFSIGYIFHSDGGVSANPSSNYAYTGFIPCSHLQGQTITLNHPPTETSGGSPGMAFYSDTFEGAFCPADIFWVMVAPVMALPQ